MSVTAPDAAPAWSGGPVWSGRWVADRLGVEVRTTDAPLGLDLADAVGLAVRRNPRRAHLLVSRLLGKHVPTDPRLVDGAGLALGELVREALRPPGGTGPTPRARLLAEAVRSASDDGLAALGALGRLPRRPATVTPAVVVGFAETATALGQCVADALGAAQALHSTRRRVPGVPPVGAFEEEHSHATTHVMLPADPAWLAGGHPLVLVDDELSTGRTVLNTITALHALAPRDRYVVATLVDVRTADDRRRTREHAAALGTRIDVVALVAGEVLLPADVADRGRAAIAAADGNAGTPAAGTPSPDRAPPSRAVPRRLDLAWPSGLPETGRHGVGPSDGTHLDDHLAAVVGPLAADLLPADRARHASPDRLAQGPAEILVLGTEELMAVPLRLAATLADHLGPAARVRFSTTTRSPVLAVDDPAYAIRSQVTFPAHDDPDDGPGPRFAYNLADAAWDVVLVVVDAAADTPALGDAGGLLDVLGDVARDVVVLALPDAAADRARRTRADGDLERTVTA